MLLLALAFFVSWAQRNGFLTPGMLFGAEVLGSCALLAAGLLYKAKEAVGRIFQAAGASALYFSVIAGAFVHDVLPPMPAAILAVGVAGTMMVFGASIASKPFYWLAAVGGLMAPFIALPGDNFSIVATSLLVLMVAASCAAASWLRWKVDLFLYAFLAGPVYFLHLLIEALEGIGGRGFVPDPYLAWAGIAMVAVWTASFLLTLKEEDESDNLLHGLVWVAGPLVAGPVIGGFLPEWQQYPASLLVGLLMACVAFLSPNKTVKSSVMVLGGTVGLLVAPWVFYWRPDQSQVTLYLLAPAAIGLVIAALAAKRHQGAFQAMALAAIAVACAALPATSTILNEGVLFAKLEWLSPQAAALQGWLIPGALGLSALAVLAAIGSVKAEDVVPRGIGGVLAWCSVSLMDWQSLFPMDAHPGEPTAWVWAGFGALVMVIAAVRPSWVAAWAALIPAGLASCYALSAPTFAPLAEAALQGLVLAMIAGTCLTGFAKDEDEAELQSWAATLGALFGLFTASRLVWNLMTHLQIETGFGFAMTIAWSLYGLSLLAFGLVPRVRNVRWVGYFVLTLAVVKALTYDISSMGEVPRMIGLAVLGLCLLFGGWVAARLLAKAAKKPKEDDSLAAGP